MFEKFTDRARRVVVLAQEEARQLGHNYIGTEHILLGLIHEGEGVGAAALEALGISHDRARTLIEEVVGERASIPSGHIPFTPRAKKVLELSLREALQLGHNYIGTEHILLGVIREGEGVAAQVLVELGAGLDTVRRKVVELLGGDPYPESSAASPPSARVTPAVIRVHRRARMLAGGHPMASHHLLLALLDEPGSVAHVVLESFGLSRDEVARRVEETGVAGTTDVLPEDEEGRRVTVRVVEGRVVVEVDDDDLADLMEKALALPTTDPDPSSLGRIRNAVRAAAAELFRRRLGEVDPPSD